MNRLQFAKGLRGLMAALVVLGLAACGEDKQGPNSVALTEQNAPAIGSLAVGLVETSLEGLTIDAFDFSDFGGVSLAAGRLITPAPHLSLSSFALDGCPSFSPDPPIDTDQDGVPDNALFTFDPQFCTTTDQTGTGVITGSVRVSDPVSAAIGFDLDINALRFAFTSASSSETLTLSMDGTRSLRGSSSLLTLDEDFSLGVEAGGQSVDLDAAHSVSFTAETPASIVFDGPLPNGTLDLSGNFQVVAPDGFFSLVLNTPVPLTYDASCGFEGDVVAGVLRAAASSQQGAAAVEVTLNGCGVQPTVVFIGSTT
ncbi:MAG: hypothetical protein HKM89_01810 [Gemmatimonadales bacterium]|nr:hypothetical protein [Gemmatimonadales bacterium]